MNYKAMLPFILVLGFFILLIFAYITYSNKAWEHEAAELKQSVIEAIKNDPEIGYRSASGDVTVHSNLNNEQIIEVVRNNLKSDPQFLVTLLENYYANKTQMEKERVAAEIASMRQELENNSSDPRIGNKNAALKIVEFFDYSCAHCKKMASINKKILQDYPNVLFIFKETPTIDVTSILTSKFALAVNILEPSKYEAFQTKLLEFNGVKNEESLLSLAKQVGINTISLRKVFQDQEKAINQQVENNLKLASALNIKGTPTYVIGSNLVAGSMSEAAFAQWINEALAKPSSDNSNSDNNAAPKVDSESSGPAPQTKSVNKEPDVKERVVPTSPSADGAKVSNNDNVANNNDASGPMLIPIPPLPAPAAISTPS